MKKPITTAFLVCISILAVIVSILSIVLFIKINNSNDITYRYFFSSNLPNQTSDVSVQWEESCSWKTDSSNTKKAQYKITINNYMNVALYDWKIQISLPKSSHYELGFNGSFSTKNDILTIAPVDYNKSLSPKASIPVGVILTVPDNFTIHNMELSIHKEYNIFHSGFFWIIFSLSIVLLISGFVFLIMLIRYKALKKEKIVTETITEQALETFANILDAKDEYTRGHSKRVSLYSMELARRMGFSHQEQVRIGRIALLHDIGKINVPDLILNKNTHLSDEEWERIKQHPMIGSEILEHFTSIPEIIVGARYHHERFDGTGYPEGLKGEDIPLIARIISVADTYDAMASTRSYRKEVDSKIIIDELSSIAGTQLDPDIVPHMISMIIDDMAPVSETDNQTEKNISA